MNWTLRTFDVHDVALGQETALVNGQLSINAEELRRKLLEDDYFEDVHLDIVRPGDDARIIHIVDVVDPRVRVSEPGSDFPGLLGPPRTVGSGVTHRLAGVAIVEAAEPLPVESTLHREAVIDMAGEGALYSPFSQNINVVLTLRVKAEQLRALGSARSVTVVSGMPEVVEYNRAIRVAGLKAAVYLAEVTRHLEPNRTNIYDLEVDASVGLPNVVYVFQTFLPYVYGEPVTGGNRAALPTIIHPNEILDGALVNYHTTLTCAMDATYLMQNHALIEELYARHGKEIAFKGVVLFATGESVREKERSASYAANLTVLLGAQGAILTYAGGGHPTLDAMMVCEMLEKRGVKTTLMVMEMAADPEDSPLPHFVSEADAIVSTGNYEQTISLGPVSSVLGGTHILGTDSNAAGPLNLPLRRILASTHKFGGGRLRGRAY